MRRDRNWVFMVIGAVCAIISVLIYWLRWYYGGPFTTVTVIHVASLVAYLLALFSWILWLARSSDRILVRAGIILVVVALLVFGFSWLASEYPIELFAISRKLVLGRSLEEYEYRYVVNWGSFFLSPFLAMLNCGVSALVLTSLGVWVTRRVLRSVNARKETV